MGPQNGHPHALATQRLPWSEPSATTVWGILHELGLAEPTVL